MEITTGTHNINCDRIQTLTLLCLSNIIRENIYSECIRILFPNIRVPIYIYILCINICFLNTFSEKYSEQKNK